MKRILLATVLLGVGWISVFGLAQQVPPGYDAASFARLGAGIRALGMGGAYVAVAEGPIGGYWNPAGLATISGFQMEGMYTNWLQADIHYQYISLGGYPPIGDQRPTFHLGEYPVTLGLSWLSVGVMGIPWWDEQGNYGTFDAWSHLFVLSAAFQIVQMESLSVGGSLKVYHDRILEGQSWGLGFDLGAIWSTEVRGVPVRIGVCTTDLGGTTVKWYGTPGEVTNYVPWLMRIGVAADFPVWEGHFLFALSYEWGLNRPRFERARVGGEIRFGWFALRAGLDQPLWQEPNSAAGGQETLAPGRWSLGAGLAPLDWVTLEYAFLPGKLGDSHLVALRISF